MKIIHVAMRHDILEQSRRVQSGLKSSFVDCFHVKLYDSLSNLDFLLKLTVTTVVVFFRSLWQVIISHYECGEFLQNMIHRHLPY